MRERAIWQFNNTTGVRGRGRVPSPNGVAESFALPSPARGAVAVTAQKNSDMISSHYEVRLVCLDVGLHIGSSIDRIF